MLVLRKLSKESIQIFALCKKESITSTEKFPFGKAFSESPVDKIAQTSHFELCFQPNAIIA